MEISKDIAWSNILERFFKDMGEKSYCYSYLHKKAEAEFSYIRNFIDLPVIVLSTIAGTLSIGNSSIFGPENERQAGMGIGLLSLCVSVLNTCGTYFGFAKRSETHRLSHIQYAKLFRFLSIELSLPREERMRPSDLLKISRDTFERLAEVSPLIPHKILNNFKKMFNSYDVSKPSETNGLEKIEIYYDEDLRDVKEKVSSNIANNIIRNMEYTSNNDKKEGSNIIDEELINTINRSGSQASAENIKKATNNLINKKLNEYDNNNSKNVIIEDVDYESDGSDESDESDDDSNKIRVGSGSIEIV